MPLALDRPSLSIRSYGDAWVSHAHPYHQISLALDGRLEVEGSAGGGVVDGGHGHFIKSGAMHAFRSLGPNRFMVLDVPEAWSLELDELESRQDGLVHFSVLPEMHHLVRFVGLAVQRNGGDAVFEGALALLLSTLARDLRGEGSVYPARLRGALAYIHRSYRRPIACEDIAAAGELSVATLHRLFRTWLNTTPTDYLVEVRLSKASELLVSTEERIAEIALGVGYGDQSALTRAFRRRFNETPARCRRARRQPAPDRR
jgi:AraC-like DNA-binding protein